MSKALNNVLFEDNQVELVGEIASDFTYSHAVRGERFFTMQLSVKRLSDFADSIPVIVSERLMDVNRDYKGECVYIAGQFRSFNRHEEGRNRLELFVFAREIEFFDTNSENEFPSFENRNLVFLDGYICKNVIYRKTPLGREIADVLLAVNRPYGHSDYLPCVCWGRNARFASTLEIGTQVRFDGRIQSRTYMKKISPTTAEKRVAYEVSVSSIETVWPDEKNLTQ